MEALLLIIKLPNKHRYNIFFDSKYARNTLTGRWSPKTNIDMVILARKIYQAATKTHHIKWTWVKGHSGNFGNDLADK